ncbi:MAG: toll/interleukin-1 receptor domain-containing protein [Clostridia bacterium]|nr:toll/interleukin-1 receptor domain-containing protein [Clostridia bacterium]
MKNNSGCSKDIVDQKQQKIFLFRLNDLEKQNILKKNNETETIKQSDLEKKRMTFKCKICGSTVSSDGSSKVYTCKKCGLEQSLPDYCSEHVSFLYGRANHYFRTKRFYKALQIFQQIAAESPDDCEAYRSIVLSRYGISYTSENEIYSKEPRINIVRSDSILNDPNYIKAISLADKERRSFYIKEAEKIEKINQEILELAQTAPSFDVIIEYRGHDSKNRHTPEKEVAERIYSQLKEEGFSVYNRQINALDPSELSYDAYLYKALYSAKIMLIFASKPEYFNDTKIVNEWSIFSERMRNKEKKIIVNCISEINENDIPEELNRNMVYNFTDYTFRREITELTEQVVNGTLLLRAGKIDSDNEESIHRRINEIFELIEKENYSEAENKCYLLLSSYPDNSSAYLGLLLCDMKVRKKEDLADCNESFVKNKNYRKILLLDKEMSAELQGYIDTINDRYIKGIYDRKYKQALEIYNNGQFNIKSMIKAKNAFDLMDGYKDSEKLSEECSLIIKELEKKEKKTEADELLERSLRFWDKAEKLQQYHYAKLAFEDLENAESIYHNIPESEQSIIRCHEIYGQYSSLHEKLLKEYEEQKRKQRDKEEQRGKLKSFFTLKKK